MKWSASVSMMFRELPPAERPAAARAAGFDGVEIQVLAESPVADWAAAARQAGIEVALINVDMGDFLAGGPGLAGVPGREAAFREQGQRALDAAVELGCRHVNVGPSRIPAGADRQACLATLVANVESLLTPADAAGVRLLVEPLNRVDTPSALLAELDDALALLGGALMGRVGLQFDAYHAAANGHDLAAAIERCAPHIAHVQFGAPGRRAPVADAPQPALLVRELQSIGYRGWIGAEYLSVADTPATFGWFTPALRAAAR